MLTARVILAEEALGIGLVDRVVPQEQVQGAARELAASIADKKPEVIAAAKRAIGFGETNGMEASMRNEERESRGLRGDP